MPAFELVVVGSGGGPDETNLSAYLLKPYEAAWEDGILALEAGSAQGALNRLLQQNPLLFNSRGDSVSKIYTASEIYSFVRCFLITHAHLDHVNGLVLSAGSMKGPRKRIYATKHTLDDLETVFSDRIWPNLASWNEEDEEHKLLYSTLFIDSKYKLVYPGISIRTLCLNHGHNAHGEYESVAFFIRHDVHNREFLFFGDVEPDSVATNPQSINVWRAAAPKIPQKLSTIFIECSWPIGRTDDTLFGHLNPEHLVDELTTLATEVVKFRKEEQSGTRTRPARKKQRRNPISQEDLVGALDGLRVYVMHCKDDLSSDANEPMRDVIVSQVRTLLEVKRLGAQISAVEQGSRIEI
ncbi:3',5'-cyclic-nucleotide phosphodiesterase [Hypsizygus marmoreus]|uniref:3',5'-cyclic-nucleotide phosphodiesterase n=1 Tax=Hypsizygus marmoreus TaxID=39966 RepID=A0A369JNR1_HYPMA|nr:3',5'-cyclic-nucleotide phosphodiesterase [Hypsizygus marmoreus]